MLGTQSCVAGLLLHFNRSLLAAACALHLQAVSEDITRLRRQLEVERGMSNRGVFDALRDLSGARHPPAINRLDQEARWFEDHLSNFSTWTRFFSDANQNWAWDDAKRVKMQRHLLLLQEVPAMPQVRRLYLLFAVTFLISIILLPNRFF